ncbi:MAG: hypothetical protein ACOYKE_11125 [Ferruginibacter sp.]
MKYILLFLTLFMLGCGSSNKLKKYYSAEDKTVLELIEKIRMMPKEKSLTDALANAYTSAMAKKRALTPDAFMHLPPGDRYMQLVKEWGVMKQLYDNIASVPAAKAACEDLWDPTPEINNARNNAAREYYNEGLDLMNYDNRKSARQALDLFLKANKAVPGYQNVSAMIRQAEDRALLKVIVRAPNYYNYGWNHWGFQNDWLQQQIIGDLNARNYRNIRFYADWEASNKRIQADKLVDLNFSELYVGQVYTERKSYKRSSKIETGQTKSIPPQPIYTTVEATVNVTIKYMESRATLDCRIYDQVSGYNILNDRFPSRERWQIEKATYTGDRRALLQEDWDKINNNGNDYPPSRQDVAQKLIKNCYNALLSRISSGVQFGE